jgi:hypothetical protein
MLRQPSGAPIGTLLAQPRVSGTPRPSPPTNLTFSEFVPLCGATFCAAGGEGVTNPGTTFQPRCCGWRVAGACAELACRIRKSLNQSRLVRLGRFPWVHFTPGPTICTGKAPPTLGESTAAWMPTQRAEGLGRYAGWWGPGSGEVNLHLVRWLRGAQALVPTHSESIPTPGWNTAKLEQRPPPPALRAARQRLGPPRLWTSLKKMSKVITLPRFRRCGLKISVIH